MLNAQRLILAAAFVVVATGMPLAQAANPLVGPWKLNVEKSKGTTYKAGTTVVAAAGEGLKFTVDLVAADDAKIHWEYTAQYDGKDARLTGTCPYGDAAALTRVDARTTRVTYKLAGKVTTTQVIAVAADGKTRTTTTSGTNAKGEPVSGVSLYEKQ